MCLRKLFQRLFYPKKAAQNKKSFNYDNLLNSMFNAEQIYKELSKKCHPDLFPDDMKEEANHMFQELHKLKFDINGMNELRQQIEILYRNKTRK